MQLKPFELVAAGHEGTLTDENESLFVKPSSLNEINFYSKLESLNQHNSNIAFKTLNEAGEEIETINSWIPKYLGCMEEGIVAKDLKQQKTMEKEIKKMDWSRTEKKPALGDSGTSIKKYAVLENLLCGYKNPNILDIKLGSTLYDFNASASKIERMNHVSQTTTSGPFGMRICGMKMKKFAHVDYSVLDSSFFDITSNRSSNCDYLSINKLLGRSQSNLDQVSEVLCLFFNNHSAGDEWTALLLNNFLQRITLLIETIENNPLKLISSSVLLIMETDEQRLRNNSLDDVLIDNDFDVLSYIEECGENNGSLIIDEETYSKESLLKQLSLSKLKLIDFGHAEIKLENTPFNPSPDQNTLKGLYSLNTVLKDIISKLYE